MSYFIQIREQDEAYLSAREGISKDGISKIYQHIHSDLGTATQEFRDERRIGPGLPYFDYGLFIADNGRYHHVRCVVDDSHAEHGVLRIVFVEHTPGRDLPPC